jgi:hypothetical protein
MINQWFGGDKFNPTEVDLIDELKEEAIQIKGINVKYMLREMVDRDYLFGESKISEFKEFFDIEMYLHSIQNHNGQADIYEKFGLTLSDQAVFEVHARRFIEEGVDYEIDRPREGDLVYMSTSDQLYEIKKVDKTEEFYQLGKNYTYMLKCDLFVYSHEALPSDEYNNAESFDLKSILDSEGDITVPETNLNETKLELVEEVTINSLLKNKNTNQ